jgi:hypothetical protein
MSVDHDIADLRSKVRELQQATKNIPVRVAAGGGGFSIRAYTTFPPIPSKYTLISIESQIWAAGPDDTAWYPLYRFTDTEGEPETTP